MASANPDGLEWSLERVGAAPVSHAWQSIVDRIAPFADYQIPALFSSASDTQQASTSASGLIGSLLVLAVASGLGVLVRRRSKRSQQIEMIP
jgi:hypothetical protein